jgi:DNA-binding FadR family transcriptional regulator
LKLKPLKTQTLTDQVEEKIRQAIINSDLQPGDKLPGELDFAEQLGVSRNIVREAISRLRMLGVLESRKKRGLILQEPEVFKGLESIIDLPVLSHKTKNELYQLRQFLELGIAPMLFANKTEKDLIELEEIVAEEEQYQDDFELSVRSDINFHIKLYKITGNKSLMHFHTILKPHMEARTGLFNPERFQKSTVISHRDLLEVLKGDDIDLYMSLMRRHLIPE